MTRSPAFLASFAAFLVLVGCTGPLPGTGSPNDPTDEYDDHDDCAFSVEDGDELGTFHECKDDWWEPETEDLDGDGYEVCIYAECYLGDVEDCDDNDPGTHPDALELCGDGVDNDCDGDVDADDGDCALCADGDGDGFVASADCDDSDAAIFPGAAEDCGDLVDNDCDGRIDALDAECCKDCTAALVDPDGDGFSSWGDDGLDGEADAALIDCDESDAAVHPGAAESCGDCIDNDCDGLVDGEDPDCASGT